MTKLQETDALFVIMLIINMFILYKTSQNKIKEIIRWFEVSIW